jgi:hypothetical protein
MSDHLDRDTGERMLRGEDTGPGPLAALLAAASAPPRRHDRRGEEAAVAAFRAARAGLDVTVPVARRLLRPRLLALKAALAGLLLALAGGVALAASPHLASSSGQRHTHQGRTPATTGGTTGNWGVPVPPHASPASSPRPDGSASHGDDGHGDRAKQGDHYGHAGRRGHGGTPGPGSVRVQVPPLPETPLPGGPSSTLPVDPSDAVPQAATPSPSTGM